MTRRWWTATLLIASVAVLLRVCNLGTFSLWLDEVFTMNAAARPLAETLELCAADAENVPVYAVVANLGLKAGLREPWIRLLPIAAGLASILLLAVWTNRWFGPTAAWLVAAFCALSPFHVRYSQELRAYPYLLLASTATLVLTDRLRSHPGWGSTLALSATIALGFYTNLTYALVLVPAAGMVLAQASPGDGERAITRTAAVTRFGVAVLLGSLAFTPWIWLISRTLVDRIARTSAPASSERQDATP